ncbi:Bacteroides conjugative transposon TraK protein [Alistipes finegoldii DSM 17242]|uniref:Bacteroides conjugative transposon TraK protein n=4 Tax=Alistipes TaxID=239759 RepID=I3YK46_ALIFI|nr:Bacteroides conjugative transposon TraK protein [Alistipes finegoldii DSM 17242]
MEFKCLTNIETSFRQLRMYALVFAGVCAVVTVAAVWMSYSFAERQRQKIYVLDNGRSLMVALSQDLAQNRPVEAREHVRRFHELFFTLSPDKAAIESNVGRALQMADKSALSYYKVLQEKGFFNRLIAGNVSQMVKVDSIRCNFDRYPYEVTTFARQRILRESTVTERSLVTTCRLVNVSRSDNNPQGFMVEALNIVETKTSRPMTAKPHSLRCRIRWMRRSLRRRHDALAPRIRERIVLAALVLLLLLYLWLLFAMDMVPELEIGHPELLHPKP